MTTIETDEPDEQVILCCAGCGVPVLTWWQPHGGLLRGEYELTGDLIWHPRCWDKQVQNWPVAAEDYDAGIPSCRPICECCGGTGWLEASGPKQDGSYITSRPCPRCDGSVL